LWMSCPDVTIFRSTKYFKFVNVIFNSWDLQIRIESGKSWRPQFRISDVDINL